MTSTTEERPASTETPTTACTWGTGCRTPAAVEVFEGSTDKLTDRGWRAMCDTHLRMAVECVSPRVLAKFPIWTLSVRTLATGRHREQVPA